jgi:tetratricopeptide (TPR) repeat protein
MAFSPDGKRIAGDRFDNTLGIWDVASGREIISIALQGETVSTLSYSPDGKRLAGAGYRGTVQVWETDFGEQTIVLKGRNARVTSLAFSPDGACLVNGSSDGPLAMWDASGAPNVYTDAEFARQANDEAWMLATNANSSSRNPIRAVELAHKAVKLVPSDGGVWNTLGVAEYRAGDWPAAEQALHKSMALRAGGDADDWLFLAMAAWQRGKQERARKYFRAARFSLGTNDQTEERTRFRREAAQLLGIPVKAPSEQTDRAAMIEVLAEIPPDSAAVYVLRAEIYVGLKEWDRADEDFLKAIAIDEKPYSPWSAHALVRLAKDDRRGYQTACAQMLKHFAQTEDAYTANAVAWTCCAAPEAAGDFAPAISLAERAVRANPRSGDFVQSLGAILYRAGRLDESIQRLEEAERLLPEYNAYASLVLARLFLAMAEEKLRHHDKAREWLELAGEAMRKPSQTRFGIPQVPDWKQRLALTILRKEAESLVENAGSPGNKR